MKSPEDIRAIMKYADRPVGKAALHLSNIQPQVGEYFQLQWARFLIDGDQDSRPVHFPHMIGSFIVWHR
jgi:hypothetical protein